MSSNAALASNLSSGRYGYDFVVATTQAAINAEMNHLLYKMAKASVKISEVWTYRENDNGEDVLTSMPLDTFKSSNQIDPFDRNVFPDGKVLQTLAPTFKTMDEVSGKLINTGFAFGLEVKLGLPKGVPIKDLPPTVVLGASGSTVMYNMCCAEFAVVMVETVSQGAKVTRVVRRYEQKPGTPWYFQSAVNLNLEKVLDSDKVSDDVKRAVNNLSGTAFSIQQLLLDLNTTALVEKAPVLTGLAATSQDTPTITATTVVSAKFASLYWTAVKETGNPIFGYTVVRPEERGSLVATKLDMLVSTPVDAKGNAIVDLSPLQSQFSTLNYVCATDGHALPRTGAFDWNWVVPADAMQFHGALAIKRDTFAGWLGDHILKEAQACCYDVNVRLPWETLAHRIVATATKTSAPPNFEIVHGPDESHVLHFHHESQSSDKAGPSDDYQTTVKYTYELDVHFHADKISMIQHVVFRLDAKAMLNDVNANLVDITKCEEHTIAVNAEGRISSRRNDLPDLDRSQNPHVNWLINLFTDLDTYKDTFRKIGQSAASNMRHIPDTDIQDFVFPGGRTFAFKDAMFSDHGDLVAHITYLDPSVDDFEALP